MAARDGGAGMTHRLFPSMGLRRRRCRHDAVDRSERPGLVMMAFANNLDKNQSYEHWRNFFYDASSRMSPRLWMVKSVKSSRVHAQLAVWHAKIRLPARCSRPSESQCARSAAVASRVEVGRHSSAFLRTVLQRSLGQVRRLENTTQIY
jgi:hypothetical protein